LRPLPLSLRKTNLAHLLARRPDGIFVAPYEQGEIGPDLFRAARNMGLEGLVSKRVDRPHRGGRSPDWVKVKNRKHPAIEESKGRVRMTTVDDRMPTKDLEVQVCEPAWFTKVRLGP
jgi:ATP-dependent DNA ligase